MNTQNPLTALRAELTKLHPEFAAALPAHIPVERFARIVMTAIMSNLDLVNCDRRSLWNASMRAAQDGLMPDGREEIIVPFKIAGRKTAQWMPMISGLRKRARQSGEISTWDCHVVHERDAFDFALGDDPHITHRPWLGPERGKVIAAYSIARLKDGEKSYEVMAIDEIEAVRKLSKAEKGPWDDFYSEMARKTVARRHAKSLPMSSDLDELIRRDDDLYDFRESEPVRENPGRRRLPHTLDEFREVEASARNPYWEPPKEEAEPDSQPAEASAA